MDKKIFDFLDKHRISVLTTILPDGTPHSAALHFAHSVEPFSFCFLTEKESRKCNHFEKGKKYPASLAIGFSEEEFIELQADGEVYVVEDDKERDTSWNSYSDKYSGSDESKNDKKYVLLKFVPKWWRYSEFKPKFFSLESK